MDKTKIELMYIFLVYYEVWGKQMDTHIDSYKIFQKINEHFQQLFVDRLL